MTYVKINEIKYTDQREFKEMLKDQKIKKEKIGITEKYYLPSKLFYFLERVSLNVDEFLPPITKALVEEIILDKPIEKSTRKIKEATSNIVHGYAYKPWSLEPVKKSFKYKNQETYALNKNILYINTCYRDYSENYRYLFKDEFSSKEEFVKTLLRKFSGKSNKTASIEAKISEASKVYICGLKIEGYDFNKSPWIDTETIKLLSFADKQMLVVDDKFYISSFHNFNKIEEFINSEPVDPNTFIESVSKHFLLNTTKLITTKIKSSQEYEKRLTLLFKEIGELKFAEKAIKNNSYLHFTQMINKIKNYPDIDQLTLTNSGFLIKTNEIWGELQVLPNEISRHYIGKFEILINIRGEPSFKYRNIAASESNKYYNQTPHGSCTGTHTSVINSCLRNMDYYSFVIAIIEMLRTLNPKEKSKTGLINNGFPTSLPKKFKEYEDFITIKLSTYSYTEEDNIEDGDYDMDDDGDYDMDDDED